MVFTGAEEKFKNVEKQLWICYYIGFYHQRKIIVTIYIRTINSRSGDFWPNSYYLAVIFNITN